MSVVGLEDKLDEQPAAGAFGSRKMSFIVYRKSRFDDVTVAGEFSGRL
jgi:hypothetical protein